MRIQKVARGCLMRKRARAAEMTSAALLKHRHAAKFLRSHAQSRDDAATRIQALHRGNMGRLRAQRMHEWRHWRRLNPTTYLLLIQMSLGIMFLLALHTLLVHGIKFSIEQLVDWTLSCLFSIAFDITALQPLICLVRFLVVQYVSRKRATGKVVVES